MSYRISYGQTIIRTELPKVRNGGKLYKIMLISCICLIIMTAVFSSNFRKCLLPGNPEVTEKALVGLVEDLKDGEPLYDSITVFCRQILENANVQPK